MSASLRSLSDLEILSRTRALTVEERELTLLVLLHLNEIERRKLHLKQGYASMFDYCTAGLGYSASAATRRIRTARCVARFPQVYALLESNEVNPSTVSQVSRILTDGNVTEVLQRIRGRSQREVEAVVAEYEPRTTVPLDRVRTVVMRVAVPDTRADRPACPGGAAGRSEEHYDRNGCNGASPNNGPGCRPAEKHDRNGCAFSDTRPDTRGQSPACHGENGGGATNLQRRAVIQFSASEAFMAKLEKVRSLAWHRLPANASFEQVFELALDSFLEHEDPAKRRERREGREGSKPVSEARATQAASRGDRGRTRARTRHIPAPVRDQVFVRDKRQCTFTGPNGRRCASRNAVQVDHIQPLARGGRSTPENLRLLCAYHNRLESERVLGITWRREPVINGP